MKSRGELHCPSSRDPSDLSNREGTKEKAVALSPARGRTQGAWHAQGRTLTSLPFVSSRFDPHAA
jgi:hypothetical protein